MATMANDGAKQRVDRLVMEKQDEKMDSKA